jgi:hypothetical protein
MYLEKYIFLFVEKGFYAPSIIIEMNASMALAC